MEEAVASILTGEAKQVANDAEEAGLFNVFFCFGLYKKC